MKLAFRYFGINDSIPLNYIKQIPNMYSVVTSLYDQKPGEKWDDISLKKLKKHCDNKTALWRISPCLMTGWIVMRC